MRLVAEWRRVLRHAWSIRLIILAGLLSGAEIALPLIDQVVEIPRGIFAGLSFVTVAAAFIARLVAQESIGGEDGK